MPSEDITISIIIVNWNTHELLCRCIESIYSTVPPISFEVIVVDNGYSDNSAEMVEELFPDVILIRSTNTGFAAGNNRGIKRAAGRFLLLLNPDAELRPGTAQHLLEFTETHPGVAAVGPKLLNSDGTLQKNGRQFPSLLRELLHITRLYRLFPRYFDCRLEWGREDFGVSAEVDCVCGACMLVRRSALDKVGMLDEAFFMYYEEVDWCLRMHRAGWKVWYLPEAEVVHHIGSSSKQIGLSRMRLAYHSQFLYFRKNKGLFQSGLLWLLSRLVFALMYIKQRIVAG